MDNKPYSTQKNTIETNTNTQNKPNRHKTTNTIQKIIKKKTHKTNQQQQTKTHNTQKRNTKNIILNPKP